ncbi:MAG: LysM peptidoglycan-binding domain-containing M23 family metallopeptidase [Desulfobulbaceae bacterium]|nr:LysM peptidoglycan-binding domain-containing M23 family metallopeptidase [Desulfobulbaceae bacterium]
MSSRIAPKNVLPLTSQQTVKTAATARQTSKKFQEVLTKATELQSSTSTKAAQPNPSGNTYAVLQGDTLSEIVASETKKLGISQTRSELYAMVNQIAAHNQMADPDTILPGQQIDLKQLSTAGSAPLNNIVLTPETVTQQEFTLPMETELQSPLTGKITSLFGMRTHPVLGETLHHDGIDISQPTGTPVKPLSSGVVTFAGNNGGYGLMVEVAHENGLTSRYAHLSALSVRKGEQISEEQIIGEVGQTGMTTGPHLHLEILRQNSPIDPLTVLNRRRIEPPILVAEARNSLRM